jgi:hypothetical protein
MMPEADIVAMSGSVSNHCCRKSTALIVMSWMNTSRWRFDSWRHDLTIVPSGSSSVGRGRPGSGGVIARMGFTNRAMSTMSWPYSS